MQNKFGESNQIVHRNGDTWGGGGEGGSMAKNKGFQSRNY